MTDLRKRLKKAEYDRMKDKYIAENEPLASNAVIYSLCQDMSHGYTREQPPYNEDVLRAACKVVIEYMKNHYSGQVENIRLKNIS